MSLKCEKYMWNYIILSSSPVCERRWLTKSIKGINKRMVNDWDPFNLHHFHYLTCNGLDKPAIHERIIFRFAVQIFLFKHINANSRMRKQLLSHQCVSLLLQHSHFYLRYCSRITNVIVVRSIGFLRFLDNIILWKNRRNVSQETKLNIIKIYYKRFSFYE